MPKFKNVSPLGALDLPLIGRVVARGEVITVTDAQAVHLAGQDATWQPVRDRARTRTQDADTGAPAADGEAVTDPDAGVAGADTQSEE